MIKIYRGVRGMFFGGRGAKSLFPIFSQGEMLIFLVEISILDDSKQISMV